MSKLIWSLIFDGHPNAHIMLAEALTIIRDELQVYFQSKSDGTGISVALENIALLETPNGDLLDDKVIISLVNIEEESTLKNQTNRRITPVGYQYARPPTYLNLYLLFTANFNGGELANEQYLNSLTCLSYVIQFFQTRKQFSLSNSPNTTLGADPANYENPDLLELDITMELYTLTFEQINHLWGSLGGRQLPFAMYKARLVAIQEREAQISGLVEDISSTLNDSTL